MTLRREMKVLPVLAVLSLLAALPLAAADEPKPIVKVTGSVERTIPDDLKVSIVVEPATELAGVPQPVVQEVTLGGEVVDPTAVVASLVADGAQHYLRLTLDGEKTKRPGTYSVLVKFPAPAPPAAPAVPAVPPAGQTAAPPAPAFKAETVKVTLSRPGVTTLTGEISMPAPLHVDRVYGFFGDVEWQPDGWPISEKSGKTSATFSPAEWSAHLTRTDGAPPQIVRLTLGPLPPLKKQEKKPEAAGSAEVVIQKAGTMQLTPRDDGHWIRPGTATGPLLLVSPQLAKPVELSLEVRSRLSRSFLFWALLASIFIGYVVRVVLEEKRLLAEARLAATGPAKELVQLIAATIDPVYKRRYSDALNVLRTAVGAETPDKINAAVKEARAQIDAIGAEVTADRKAATDAIVRVLERAGDPQRQTGKFREIAEDAIHKAAELSAMLERGLVSEPRRSASELEKALGGKLDAALPAWRTATDTLLDELRMWPDVQSGDLDALTAAMKALTADTALDSAADINGELRARLDQVTLPALRRLTDEVVKGLGKLPKSDERAKQIAAIETASVAVQGLDAAGMADPKPMRDALIALRERIVDALTKAQQTPVPELTAGKFQEAMRAILKQYQTVAQAKEVAAPEPPLAPLVDSTAVTVGAATTPIGVSIVLDGVPIVNEPLRLRAVLTGDPAVLRRTRLQWFADKAALVLSEPGETWAEYRPHSTDPVELKVVVKTGGAEREATLLITPHAREWHDAEALQRAASQYAGLQTGVAALITFGGGLVIFFDAWLGTPQQFFAVLLWGFSVDFSVARVLELAKPLLEQKVPLPKPAGQ